LSHVDEFGIDDLLELRSANAPAAMYFTISVLPISTTSGAVPPAIAASSFGRCCVHCWYSTLTSTSGCCCCSALVAAATTSGQLFCASSCSHTVRVVDALRADVPAAAVAAPAASTTA